MVSTAKTESNPEETTTKYNKPRLTEIAKSNTTQATIHQEHKDTTIQNKQKQLKKNFDLQPGDRVGLFSEKKAVLSQRRPCDAQSDNTHMV